MQTETEADQRQPPRTLYDNCFKVGTVPEFQSINHKLTSPPNPQPALTINQFIDMKGIKIIQGTCIFSNWRRGMPKLSANIKSSYGKKAERI